MTNLNKNSETKHTPGNNSFAGKYRREYTNDVLIVKPDNFKVIKRNGFEYTLCRIVTNYRRKHHVPVPAFLGFTGYALQSFKKIPA